MTKFLYKLFIFLLIIKLFDILLSSFFAWSLHSIRYLDEDRGSLNRMYIGAINADIIFLGSSRTYVHVNPEIIQNVTQRTAWNLGMDGSNFEQHKFTLEEYLLHNKSPKIAVFEADLISLDDGFLSFDKDLFLPYSNYSGHTLDLFTRNWEDTLYYSFFSSAPYKQQIPVVITNYQAIFEGIKSGGNMYEALTKSEVVTKDYANYVLVNGAQLLKGQVLEELPPSLPISTPVRYSDFSEINQRGLELEGIAQLAEENGFILVLMFPPWLNGAIDESQRQTAIHFYSQLAQRYQNTYFLDYSQDALLSNKLIYWRNEAHLNITGANILSTKIGEELNEILLENGQ